MCKSAISFSQWRQNKCRINQSVKNAYLTQHENILGERYQAPLHRLGYVVGHLLFLLQGVIPELVYMSHPRRKRNLFHERIRLSANVIFVQDAES